MLCYTLLSIRRILRVAVMAALSLQLPTTAIGSPLAQRAKKRQRPPASSSFVCVGVSADCDKLHVGEHTRVQALATDAAGAVLTFEWRVTGGSVVGDGSTVEYYAPKDRPGRYLITALVKHPKGYTFECSTEVEVLATSAAPHH
jgi:hypothetical protein